MTEKKYFYSVFRPDGIKIFSIYENYDFVKLSLKFKMLQIVLIDLNRYS